MGPSPHLWFCAFATATLSQELIVSMGPRPHLSFCACKNSVISTRINSLYGSQTSPVVLCMQNKVIIIRITSLYGSQPSSVVFACKSATFGSDFQVSIDPSLRLLICEWNRVLRSRMMLVYCSQPSSVVLCIQNSDFSIRITSLYGSQTSPVGLWMQNRVWIDPEWRLPIGPSLNLWFWALKTATLASESIVSMRPSRHLCLLRAKQHD